eukprot:6309001-Prymnesium_polylepis.1
MGILGDGGGQALQIVGAGGLRVAVGRITHRVSTSCLAAPCRCVRSRCSIEGHPARRHTVGHRPASASTESVRRRVFDAGNLNESVASLFVIAFRVHGALLRALD